MNILYWYHVCLCDTQAARALNPLVKTAAEAASLAERAWLLSVFAAAKGAAAGKSAFFIRGGSELGGGVVG